VQCHDVGRFWLKLTLQADIADEDDGDGLFVRNLRVSLNLRSGEGILIALVEGITPPEANFELCMLRRFAGFGRNGGLHNSPNFSWTWGARCPSSTEDVDFPPVMVGDVTEQ